MKRQILAVVLILGISMLAGCSYKQFEDSVKEGLSKERETDAKKNLSAAMSSDSIPQNGAYIEEGKNVYYKGDTFVHNSAFGLEEVEYIVKDIYWVDNVSEFGITKDDFIGTFPRLIDGTYDDKELLAISDSGEIVYQDGRPAEGKMLLVKLNIKNIGSNNTGHKDDERDFFMGISLGSEEGILRTHSNTWDIAYYSEHPPLTDGPRNDYYYFSLPVGTEKEVLIGWFVTEEFMQQPLYCLIGGHELGKWDYWKYIKVSGEDEEK